MSTQKIILIFLKGYKQFLSPGLPKTCRFYPTCSDYASSAVVKFGCKKGVLMAVRRLLRCHPFNPGGYDPVP
jgi:putative membrane protein insertion efficiency factor